MFDKVDLALVGIGDVEPSKLLAQSGNKFSSDELEMLRARGAVCDILLRFFDVAKKLIESVGGTLECFYYAFGEYDFYAIADVPDHSAMVALSLTLNATGAIRLGTTVLLTAEEMDAATKISPTYRAPGQ